MSTQSVRCVLRIIAAVTVLVGAIGVSTTLVAVYGIHFVSQSTVPDVYVRGTVASMGLLGVFTWFVVIAWGLAFYQVSGGLARLITSEPEPAKDRGLSAPRTDTLRG
jgi:hypothetical protein